MQTSLTLYTQISKRTSISAIFRSKSDCTKLLKHVTKTTADQVLDESATASGISQTIVKKVIRPLAVFPWRHSPFPLSRLVPGTLQYYTEGGALGPNFPLFQPWAQNVVWFCSVYLLRRGGDGLGVTSSWLSYFRWKREMEDGFMYAFALGVQGVLVDVYQAKIPSIDESIDITTPAYEININQTINLKENNAVDSGDNEEDAIPDLQDMLHPRLQELYQSAHRHAKSKLKINLQSRPKEAEIISLNLVNMTRDDVDFDPLMKTAYVDLAKKLQIQEEGVGRSLNLRERIDAGVAFFEELMAKQHRRLQDDDVVMQCTMTAQVAITCDEIFRVEDLETGLIVQGGEDNNAKEDIKGEEGTNDPVMKEAIHVVRFEMIVDIKSNGNIDVSQWQITDWDDLLNGNTWFSA